MQPYNQLTSTPTEKKVKREFDIRMFFKHFLHMIIKHKNDDFVRTHICSIVVRRLFEFVQLSNTKKE